MKLNTGIISQSLPYAPSYVCGRPDHPLTLCDVRFLPDNRKVFSEDILYFAEWSKLSSEKKLPGALFCGGGGAEAAELFKKSNITGIIAENEDPIVVFGIIQSISSGTTSWRPICWRRCTQRRPPGKSSTVSPNSFRIT
jgi:hypothetical protein